MEVPHIIHCKYNDNRDCKVDMFNSFALYKLPEKVIKISIAGKKNQLCTHPLFVEKVVVVEFGNQNLEISDESLYKCHPVISLIK